MVWLHEITFNTGQLKGRSDSANDCSIECRPGGIHTLTLIAMSNTHCLDYTHTHKHTLNNKL